jgi:peptidoglycan/xylan/chitin deacetylase (PgdA/CDA1 family)
MALVVAAGLLVVACGGTPTGQGTPTGTPSGTTAAPSTPTTATTSTAATEPSTTKAPTTTKPATTKPATTKPPATTTGTGIPASLLGTDWTRVPTSRKVVALTFDAGASDAGVASILATLAAQHVTATFFLTGDFVRRYPAQAARIAAAGHVLGNHSNTHPHFPALTDAQIRAQLAAAESAIVAATGRAAKPFFRFPFGDRTAADIRVVNAAGYICIRWTVDTLGWKGTSGGITTDTVVSRVLDALQPGEIVLMHVGANPDDHTTLDADALPRVIRELRDRGYSFVTLRAML